MNSPLSPELLSPPGDSSDLEPSPLSKFSVAYSQGLDLVE
jgi:hypothetical protein